VDTKQQPDNVSIGRPDPGENQAEQCDLKRYGMGANESGLGASDCRLPWSLVVFTAQRDHGRVGKPPYTTAAAVTVVIVALNLYLLARLVLGG
jgi:hypothetical protein